MKLHVCPGRVVVKRREAKLKGGIHLPPNRAKLYEIGEVVAVGDLSAYGPEGKISTKETYKAGDIVLFQLPMSLAAMVTHKIKDVLHAFISAEDIIAKLESDTISYENFKIAGRFVMLQADVRQPNKIIIPDAADEAKQESLHFSILQLGADVKMDVAKGQEVFPDKGRVNPLNIDGKDYAFCDQQHIYGALV
jgi:co-chaperonin GroES (HSP10)